ncbi:MAG: hypothetical protein JWO36_5853 [Myxococcales bacterium]|nr:hypothetical protein [Myxococcales bacterium]
MKRPWFSSLVVLGAALSQMGSTGGSCGGQVLRDPGFDLWCGTELCAWKVERGQANRVATWHEGDSGVELAGPDSAIEQLSPVTSGDGHCIKFDLVSNVAEDAEVYFNVDVQSDGTLEMHERIPTSHWKPLTYSIFITAPYDGIRFELTKRGAGSAVLANIEANIDGASCTGLTPLDIGPRKNGSTCNMNSECASGLCIQESAPLSPRSSLFGTVCAGCDPHNPVCGTGEACGVAEAPVPVLVPPVECVAAASRELGEMCISNAECGTGICRLSQGAAGSCSSCRFDTDCTGGETCNPAWPTGPSVCGGLQHLAPHGAPCGSDDDCATGSCSGAVRKECTDRRVCSTAADCPFGNTGSNGLQNGACNRVGIQGGSCD